MAQNVTALTKAPVDLGRGQSDDGLAGTRTSGPRGIESVIEFNGLFLNVRSWVDTFLVTTINGIDDADIRDNREVNPGYHGETAFPALYGGRTITLSGKVITRTLFKLRDMQQALRAAFAPLASERPLIFRADVPENDMIIYCRKSQPIQMADEQRTANHFERPFQITLRASNPRFFGSVLQWHEGSFAGATFDAIIYTLYNVGNITSQPLIEISGPATTMKITDEANGDIITLTGAVPAAETWVIDIENKRMYRKSDSANRFMYLDVNSDWLELQQDGIANPIRVTATGLTSASRVNFSHRNTYI